MSRNETIALWAFEDGDYETAVAAIIELVDQLTTTVSARGGPGPEASRAFYELLADAFRTQAQLIDQSIREHDRNRTPWN
jgi:hypothetical protein